jgi:hypothetical protein
MRHLALLFACGVLQAQTPDLVPQSLDPQSLHERWDSYVNKTYGWKKIGIVTAETMFGQTFQLSKCGRPPYCFPHELGGALTRRTTRTTIEFGVGALLHEDLRRRPSGLHGFRQRFTYAFLHAPLAIGSDGAWELAYSRYAGTMGGLVVSSAWNGKPLTAARLSQGFGWSSSSYFQDALWTEFGPDLKLLGRHVADKLRPRPKP